jgi:hypothetical protein
MAIRNILLSFNKSYGHIVHFVVILHIFPRFGMFYQNKSGNPGGNQFLRAKVLFRRLSNQRSNPGLPDFS